MRNRVNLPPGSEVYGDSAYTDYTVEDDLEQTLSYLFKSHAEKELQASRPTLESIY
ncbi:MAG: hypothetical protein V7L12_01740 [Nostoc sp.]